jgi:hypothetical protein
VLLWWRDSDGDLVDGLVDSLTDLGEGGPVQLAPRPLERSPAHRLRERAGEAASRSCPCCARACARWRGESSPYS